MIASSCSLFGFSAYHVIFTTKRFSVNSIRTAALTEAYTFIFRLTTLCQFSYFVSNSIRSFLTFLSFLRLLPEFSIVSSISSFISFSLSFSLFSPPSPIPTLSMPVPVLFR
jgi:hypothetical protein